MSGDPVIMLSRDDLGALGDRSIASALEDHMGFPGDGYCELIDSRLVCVARIPLADVVSIDMRRAVILVDRSSGKVYAYIDRLDQRMREMLGRRASPPRDSREAFQAILERISSLYEKAVNAIEEEIDRVEDLIEEEDLALVAKETYRLRKTLINLRRGVRNYVQMLREINEDQGMRDLIPDRLALLELIDEGSVYLETLELYRETLTSIREAHASIVGLRLNEVVKRLTAITVVLMLPTLIASIYGMNFDKSYPFNMPELSWSFGYIYALGLMLASSIAGYLVLKARGWF